MKHEVRIITIANRNLNMPQKAKAKVSRKGGIYVENITLKYGFKENSNASSLDMMASSEAEEEAIDPHPHKRGSPMKKNIKYK